MARKLSFRQLVAGLFGTAAAAQRRARKPHDLTPEYLEPRITPAATVSIADGSVLEPAPGGTVNLDFTVTRTGDLVSRLTVGYTTVAGTAQAGTDFTPTIGAVTFASGSATATISIPVFGNGVFNNPDLSFSVQLTGISDNVVGPPVTLGARTTFDTGNSPSSVVVGDVNGDGRPDLVTTNLGDNTVSVLLNTTAPGATTPTFTLQPTVPMGRQDQPRSVAVGDLNGDGRPDIVVADFSPNSVSVLVSTTALPTAAPAYAPSRLSRPAGASRPSWWGRERGRQGRHRYGHGAGRAVERQILRRRNGRCAEQFLRLRSGLHGRCAGRLTVPGRSPSPCSS